MHVIVCITVGCKRRKLYHINSCKFKTLPLRYVVVVLSFIPPVSLCFHLFLSHAQTWNTPSEKQLFLIQCTYETGPTRCHMELERFHKEVCGADMCFLCNRARGNRMHTQLLIRHIDQLEFSTIGLFLFLLIWRNDVCVNPCKQLFQQPETIFSGEKNWCHVVLSVSFLTRAAQEETENPDKNKSSDVVTNIWTFQYCQCLLSQLRCL